jgi:hypothetical protein
MSGVIPVAFPTLYAHAPHNHIFTVSIFACHNDRSHKAFDF